MHFQTEINIQLNLVSVFLSLIAGLCYLGARWDGRM